MDLQEQDMKVVTDMTRPQLKDNRPKAKNLLFTFQDSVNDYESK